ETLRMLHGLQERYYSSGVDSYTASRKALGALYGMVQEHAAMLSFVECFWVMGVVFAVMVPFILLLRNPRSKLPAPKPQPIGLVLHRVIADKESAIATSPK